MRTAVHGMARIGAHRELKWALERYWASGSGPAELLEVAAGIRRDNLEVLAQHGVDFAPVGDFSLYDHVLDAALAVGAIPGQDRLAARQGGDAGRLAAYFALARGGEVAGGFRPPLQLTKWFDTNYHHLVPEIAPDTEFRVDPAKLDGELAEAAALGIAPTPVLLGPFTLLARSTGTRAGFSPLALLDRLCGAYEALLTELRRAGMAWVRLDEPALVEDRSPGELEAFGAAYARLCAVGDRPHLAVSTFFGHPGPAMRLLRELPVEGVGLDFCAGPENLALIEQVGGLPGKALFAGVVDGRNVWANDLGASLDLLERLSSQADEVVISTSCSLLHVPIHRSAEAELAPEVEGLLAFGEEKLAELATLARGASEGREAIAGALEENRQVRSARRASPLRNDPAVRRALAAAAPDPRRRGDAATRAALQQGQLRLPLLPTTTIGSFPQTKALRSARAAWRAGELDQQAYESTIKGEIDRAVALQEDLGIDVLVHGEAERDDMVRHFAAALGGFVLPEHGWVQSYGSRCVRPPVLFGDVVRPAPIALAWWSYAQGQTTKPMKAVLTGPVTMLSWSFVRDDQPLSESAAQLALALGDELADLQSAGASVIQVDEPGLRELLPLRRAARQDYLAWATRAFRLVTAAALPATQVHTHMCYAELKDVAEALAALDVDVISLEASRARGAVLEDLDGSGYEGAVGPGVYDVHAATLPSVEEIAALLRRACALVAPSKVWVNPDCGLKTRSYSEVAGALKAMVTAATHMREELAAGGAG